ncbi:Aldo-keto reductase yakc [NADP(+)] [Auxenochlorella protothecoides]|uniref:Aldo-keto reductase yakc [NADP(+)] n=1 Tax=Auxenochlorella protothecoides TaxID=3075 RepID=A0A087SRC6_AUXPR|nr:Aldo-keto reductase yakc [NADP(+)] [Auxenochlorella protothecoides]KFM28280.1 Aldo-keto reductase yakc [NADP(+)] [Auxenochlorella protothecoides]RMZ52895.1 hypothetical protein APUTEX25_001014 [Auxenochlorella protothecoides]|eukprot:RMZ52895.1 hypothetical protein APUTEX25_001014 [Auxenochlorella protothecoides]
MSLTDGFYKSDVSEEGGIQVLHRAAELGVTLINTAVFYGAGVNETLIGKAFPPEKIESLVIATKWGLENDFSTDFSPAAARRAVEGSLKRTGKKAVDVLTLRGPLPEDYDLELVFKGVKALVDERLVKHVGLSEVTAEQIKAAHAIVPITLIELEWSLFSREAEASCDDIIPTARGLGIGFLAYSPLGRGILAGRFSSTAEIPEGDFRAAAQPRFQGENFAKNLALAEALRGVAGRKGVTPGQLALAWLLAQGDDVVPIPGTKSVKYLEQNVAAAGVRLTREELDEVEAAVPAGAAAGGRY